MTIEKEDRTRMTKRLRSALTGQAGPQVPAALLGAGPGRTGTQGWPRPTLLDERVCCQLPAARIGVLLVGVLPVVVPLQRTRDVAGVMAVSTAERLRGKGVQKSEPQGKQRSAASLARLPLPTGQASGTQDPVTSRHWSDVLGKC